MPGFTALATSSTLFYTMFSVVAVVHERTAHTRTHAGRERHEKASFMTVLYHFVLSMVLAMRKSAVLGHKMPTSAACQQHFGRQRSRDACCARLRTADPHSHRSLLQPSVSGTSLVTTCCTSLGNGERVSPTLPSSWPSSVFRLVP